MIGRLKGYKVAVVMPENVSVERVQLLEAYGAEIISSDGSRGTNGSIEVAQDLVEKNPHDYVMMYQYGNSGNPGAHYETTGPEIIGALPEVDMFVGWAGHRRHTHGGCPAAEGTQPRGQDRGSRSGAGRLHLGPAQPGRGLHTTILDINLLDSRMLVGSFEAFHTAKRLLNEEGIFAGVSSGSVVYGAIRQAERMESGTIVCLLADGGWKYLSTSLWTKDYDQLREKSQGKIWW